MKIIFVVSGDEHIQGLIRQCAGREDVVLTESSLRTAVSRIGAVRPDILVCDVLAVEPPEARSSLEHVPGDLPVLAIAGTGGDGSAMAPFQACGVRVLAAPFSEAQFQAALNEAAGPVFHVACDAVEEPPEETVVSEESLPSALRATGGPVWGGLDSLLGESAVFQEWSRQLRKTLAAPSTVLLSGEPGTGKSMAAEALCREGAALAAPCVWVRCWKNGSENIAAMLVDRRTGQPLLASGGAFVLEEIDTLPTGAQERVQALLHQRNAGRARENCVIGAKAAVIATISMEPARSVSDGRLRPGLLSQFRTRIEAPPLRERAGDIRLLALAFWREWAPRIGAGAKGLTSEALERLESYGWPGNVRELDDTVRRLLLYNPDKEWIGLEETSLLLDGAGRLTGQPQGTALESAINRIERRLICSALEQSGGNQSRAATLLGTTRRILKYKMEKLGVEVPPEIQQAGAGFPA